MSRRRKGRNISGVLVLDKPPGVTSNGILQQVKRLYGAAKAGHTGALDPLATGVLPLCFGEATKFSQQLLDADKTYLTVARLGVRTKTSDADGETVAEKPLPADLGESTVEPVLSGFRGAIEQVPSMYSALKYEGRPLYSYAREGRTVPRQARPIRIHELTLVALEGADLTLRVRCSKGTYIRTLVDDIGEALGCGAHVSVLRREAAGEFTLDEAVTPEALEGEEHAVLDQRLQPTDRLLSALPAIELAEEEAVSISNGQSVIIRAHSFPPGGGHCRLYCSERFLGMGEVDPQGTVLPRRLMQSAVVQSSG